MSDRFTLREMAIMAIALDEEQEERKRRRRYWVHNMFINRKTEGEYHTIYRYLMEDEEKFYRYFHMPRRMFKDVLEAIEASIRKNNTRFRESISPEEKLAVTLRYLITGSSFRTLSSTFRLGETTIRRIVQDVCKAIIEKLMSIHMPQPTVESWQKIEEDFRKIWNFPNCIGAFDGKHVNIIAPPNSGSLFFNYKKSFSIVLMAVVDAHYRFTAVDIGAYGKNSDGGIYSSSVFGQAVENNAMNIPSNKPLPGTEQAVPHVFVADEAFPLKPYLMRPYPRSTAHRLMDAEREYNYRLSRARRVVENAFGILYQKFQIYNKNIDLHPKYVDNVVLTTCILHNMMRSHNIHASAREERAEITLGGNRLCSQLPNVGGNHTTAAFNIREIFKNYFQSAVGRLPWQSDYS